MLPNGTPKRLDTYIDIPLEIGLPHFISDERMKEEGPLFGNFKLVLQSVVCHRGVSVDSGHYIALVRADCHERPHTSSSNEDELAESWLRFDDLSNQRVTNVDIKQALRDESPYLLFYQVQPIDAELASRGDPPPYTEAQTALTSLGPSRETLASINTASVSASASATDLETSEGSNKVDPTDLAAGPNHSDELLGRNSSSSNRRSSIAFEDTEGSIYSASRGRTQPPTPDDQKSAFLSVSRRGSRVWLAGANKSRPSSPSNESRLSLTLSRLTGRGSKDKLYTIDTAVEDPTIVINEVASAENGQKPPSPIKDKKETSIGRSKSKSKKDKKEKHRSKSRDPGPLLEKGKTKDKERPDRECMVM